MDSLTHLDLCSGIGGFHLAAEWAGFRTVGFSEIEPYCCKLLAEKWPEIKNYGDLRRADFSGLRGTIDVLSAGVPCQPASLAGKRRGALDDRWLWEAVLDVVESVEPAWCIFENPPGILTLGEFGGVLLRLESLGYEVRAFSVPANAVGAKHRRQRVFVVCHAEHAGCNRSEVTNGFGPGEIQGQQEPVKTGQSAGPSCGADGNEVVAQSESKHGWVDERGTETGARASTQSGGTGGDTEALADADRAGLPGTECETVLGTRRWKGGRATPEFCWRLTEPPLCRATDGIRNRSHRLKALGNSVVPQQAYPFFEAIAQIEV